VDLCFERETVYEEMREKLSGWRVVRGWSFDQRARARGEKDNGEKEKEKEKMQAWLSNPFEILAGEVEKEDEVREMKTERVAQNSVERRRDRRGVDGMLEDMEGMKPEREKRTRGKKIKRKLKGYEEVVDVVRVASLNVNGLKGKLEELREIACGEKWDVLECKRRMCWKERVLRWRGLYILGCRVLRRTAWGEGRVGWGCL
jgi:hypothetical protein